MMLRYKGRALFFLSLPEHGTQPGGLYVKGTRTERIPPPLTDQLDLNQLLPLLKTFFSSSALRCAALLIDTFSFFLSVQNCKRRAYERSSLSVVHVLGGKKFDIYIMQLPSFLHPRQNVN